MEGMTKTILVKQGLVDNTTNKYCLPKAVASQVIQDIHLSCMHIGIDGIVQQAQRFIWMPGLYSAVRRELTNCIGCMQKHKLQRDIRVEHCFYPREKGSAAQIVHLDLARPLPTTKEGYKYILGITDKLSSFVMAVAIKGKTHKEVTEAFANNWTYRLGAPEFVVSDNEVVSQAV